MFFSWLGRLRNLLVKNSGETNEDPECNETKNFTSLYQIFISSGPLILTAGVGAMMGFSGIFLPQLELEDTRIKNVDINVGSWIAASAVLPLTFSSLLGGFFMEKIGRKWAHIISSIPGIIGWIIISFSQDISSILIGRVLTGMSCGLIAPVTAVYIGEVTSPSLRPFILGGIALNLTIGTLLCHLVGIFYTWETTALFCLLFPAVGGFFTLFSHETPTWLVGKERIEEACATFKKIRGESEETMKELDIALEKHKERKETVQEGYQWYIFPKLVTRPEIFKPFLILVFYFVSAQFAGINVVTFYAINVVERSLGSNFKEKYLVMLSMDVIRMVTSILACILLRKFQRRHIAFIGGTGCFICLLTLGISSYILDVLPNSDVFVYAPLLALLGYVFFISISLVPLPWCLAGELVPHEVKGLASSVICFTAFSAFFISVKCAPFLFDTLGTSLTYLIFSSSALFGTALCYFFLPETKDKTLSDIAGIYSRK